MWLLNRWENVYYLKPKKNTVLDKNKKIAAILLSFYCLNCYFILTVRISRKGSFITLLQGRWYNSKITVLLRFFFRENKKQSVRIVCDFLWSIIYKLRNLLKCEMQSNDLSSMNQMRKRQETPFNLKQSSYC